MLSLPVLSLTVPLSYYIKRSGLGHALIGLVLQDSALHSDRSASNEQLFQAGKELNENAFKIRFAEHFLVGFFCGKWSIFLKNEKISLVWANIGRC